MIRFRKSAVVSMFSRKYFDVSKDKSVVSRTSRSDLGFGLEVFGIGLGLCSQMSQVLGPGLDNQVLGNNTGVMVRLRDALRVANDCTLVYIVVVVVFCSCLAIGGQISERKAPLAAFHLVHKLSHCYCYFENN